MAKKKESSKKQKERLEKMRARIKELEDENKLKKDLEEQEKRLKKLRTERNKSPIRKKTENIVSKATSDSGLNLLKIKSTPRFNENAFISEQSIRRIPTSPTNRMWLMSVWENRKELDPERFDPDNWFNSSTWLDNPQPAMEVERFWNADSFQESKNRDSENYWMRDTMWKNN
jgi:hypothetical protein